MESVLVVIAVPIEMNGRTLTVHADKDDLGYRVASVLYTYGYKEGYHVVADPLNRLICNAALGFDDIEEYKGKMNEAVIYETENNLSLLIFSTYMAKIIPPEIPVYVGLLEDGMFTIEIPEEDLYAVNACIKNLKNKILEVISDEDEKKKPKKKERKIWPFKRK